MSSSTAILTSWKEIAQYMGKGVRTVQRWEQYFGLTVRRPMGSEKKAVLPRTADLDAWLALRCVTRASYTNRNGPNSNMILARSQMAGQIETSRGLCEANHTASAEVLNALRILREQPGKMCNKVLD